MRKDYPQVVARATGKKAGQGRHQVSTLMNVAPQVTQQVTQMALFCRSCARKCLIYKASVGRS